MNKHEFPIAQILYPVSVIIFIVSAINNKMFIAVFALIFFFIAFCFSVRDIARYFKLIKDIDDIDLTNIDTFLVKNDTIKPRKKDGNIQKGDVKLCFADDVFKIVQGEEIIENKIQSIRYLDIWKYEGDIYFKIAMRSHTEYIFKNTKDELSIVSALFKKYKIEIQDNRFNE